MLLLLFGAQVASEADAAIVQIAPFPEQVLAAFSAAESPGRGAVLLSQRPTPTLVGIRQFAPFPTQGLSIAATDDELVLMLLGDL